MQKEIYKVYRIEENGYTVVSCQALVIKKTPFTTAKEVEGISEHLSEVNNGWNRHKAAVHLAMTLGDEALQVSANQPLSELQDIEQ